MNTKGHTDHMVQGVVVGPGWVVGSHPSPLVGRASLLVEGRVVHQGDKGLKLLVLPAPSLGTVVALNHSS